MEKARLRALHDGKYDEFKKLVADTKNKRLQHLLDQTDKYLGDIGARRVGGAARDSTTTQR